MSITAATLLGLALLAVACDREAADPTLSSPRATVMTLLRAHHLDRMPAQEIQRRMSRSDDDRFGAVDDELVARCFEDFDPDDPVDHGLVGFLVGVLAARRDELQAHTTGDRATVAAGPVARVVLHRSRAGWRISLDESVPRAYRERMQSLYDRARKGAGR